MSSERPRQVPLAVPFGRQLQSRSRWRELLLSAALHLGVLVALVWGGRHLAEASGRPGEGPGLGGGGGGGGKRPGGGGGGGGGGGRGRPPLFRRPPGPRRGDPRPPPPADRDA